MQVNPKTRAVIDAFLDLDTPESLRPQRRAALEDSRIKLFNALQELVEATKQ